MKQEEFLSILTKLKETALSQDNTLEIDQVKEALKDANLNDTEMDLVYSYMAENKISITGITMEIPSEENELSEDDNRYLNMYLDELKELPDITNEELTTAIIDVKNGNTDKCQVIINAYLEKVVDIAKSYTDHGMLLEDIIQEGNIGLICGVNALTKLEKLEDAEELILEAVKMAIVTAIDDNTEETNLEETVVAKVNLIQEAATLLEKDLGHAPSIRELADYTKMTYDEVNDIISLSKTKQ